LRVSRILGSYRTLHRGLLLTVTVTNQDAKTFLIPAILLLHRKMEHDGNADPHDSRRVCKKVSESAACLRSRLAWALGLARRTREDELMRRS
jgi:hypothetical protein